MGQIKKSEVEPLTNDELIERTIIDPPNRGPYLDEIQKRRSAGLFKLADGGYRPINGNYTYSHKPQPAHPQPQQLTQQPTDPVERVLALQRDPHDYAEFYRAALDLGWRGEHMRDDHEGAVRYALANAEMNEPWEELYTAAQAFYKAARFAIVQYCMDMKASKR